MSKKKLFLIADATVTTGFATVSHNLIEHLSMKWEIHVLAINYRGDYSTIMDKARLYNPAAVNPNDYYGYGRVNKLARDINPDVILIINDTWIGAKYLKQLKDISAPKLLYTPVDMPGIKQEIIKGIQGFNHVIAYTAFGKTELQKAGLQGMIDIIPHGVNTNLFRPIDQALARKKFGIPLDRYIVQVVDRNSSRKQVGTTLDYFARWIQQTNKPANVFFHYHGALNDEGPDIEGLARDLGIGDRLMLTSRDITTDQGIPLAGMPFVYSLADVGFSASTGEGWHLPTMERFACRVPMIAPNHSAFADWAREGIEPIEVSDIPLYSGMALNTRGQLITPSSAIEKLELIYQNPEYRQQLAEQGYQIATRPEYNWRKIADRFDTVFRENLQNVR